MTEAEKYYHKLVTEIPDVKASKMFGADCMKTPNGKSAAMFWKECIVIKLSGDKMNEALSLDGAKVFEPAEGRPMGGWIQIPFEYKNKWKKFTLLSVEEVKKLEKKAPLKKKK